jgi:hypothetical protein
MMLSAPSSLHVGHLPYCIRSVCSKRRGHLVPAEYRHNCVKSNRQARRLVSFIARHQFPTVTAWLVSRCATRQ